MRLFLSVCLVVCGLAISGAAYAQKIPSDFRLELTAGPVHEEYPEFETDTNRVIITADGTLKMGAWNSPYGPLEQSEKRLSKKQMRALYKIVRKADVFGLQSYYINPQIDGGDLGQVILTQSGKTKTVRFENVTQADAITIIRHVNSLMPPQRSVLTMAMFRDDFPEVPR